MQRNGFPDWEGVLQDLEEKLGLKGNKEFLVAMRPGDTPVPIPNTMVKPRTADGTLLETARESRWLPESRWAYSSAG